MHHHSVSFMVLVFSSFATGAAINIWRHASDVVNSSLNGISTYGQFFKRNGAVQATKTFAALLGLLYWLYHQTAIEALGGLPFPGGVAPQWIQGILVVNPATSGALGLFLDVVEDFALVYLRKRFPNQFPPEVPPTLQSAIAKAEAKTPS